MNIFEKLKGKVDPAEALKALGLGVALIGMAINKKVEDNDKKKVLEELGKKVKDDVLRDISKQG